MAAMDAPLLIERPAPMAWSGRSLLPVYGRYSRLKDIDCPLGWVWMQARRRSGVASGFFLGSWVHDTDGGELGGLEASVLLP